MKFKMASNSLFAILLRSPWWISAAIAAALSLLAWSLLPQDFRAAGALSSFPFMAIAVMAAWRQRGAPSAARVSETAQAVSAMAWPAFADLLEQAFRRDGYAVQRRSGSVVDFELQRQGRTMLVAAKRWKSARTGLDPLRELQAARDASEAPDALWIGLGELTDSARPFVAEHRIALWQVTELAQALRGLPLKPTPRP